MEMNQKPIFSVVTPTHGRIGLIKDIFISLKKAIEVFQRPVEVILIDSSSQETADEIRKMCKAYSFIYIKSDYNNARTQRNLGIEKAKGDFIFFVDSDCEIEPNSFIEHFSSYTDSKIGGVLGLTRFKGPESLALKIAEKAGFIDGFRFAETLKGITDSAPWGTFTSISFRREVFNKVGLLDTKLPCCVGGEDVDFGIKVNKAGYKIAMNPKAITYHTTETWQGLKSVIQRAIDWGRSDFGVFYKNHSDMLVFSFLKPITIFALMMIVGLIDMIACFSFIGLLLGVIWLMLFFVLQALPKCFKANNKLKDFTLQMLGQFILFLFDFGTGLESLKNRTVAFFYHDIVYSPNQIKDSLWNQKLTELWNITISLSLVLIFSLFI